MYLDSGLRKVDFQRHLLPHEDVRVAGFGEQSLQDVQLRAGEGGPLPPLLPGSRCGETDTDQDGRKTVRKNVDKKWR